MWRNSLPYISRYTRTGAPRFYSRNSEHIAHAKPSWVPFFNAKYGNFVQDPPRIENQYIGNAFMQNYLQVHLPSEVKIVDHFFECFTNACFGCSCSQKWRKICDNLVNVSPPIFTNWESNVNSTSPIYATETPGDPALIS